MPLLDLPNEILLGIAEYFDQKDFYSFFRTNHFFTTLFTHILHEFALQDKDNIPSICWAAKRGYEPLVRLLLAKKVDINSTARTRDTPLHRAVQHGRVSVVRLLVGNGANINAVDHKIQTPLHLAVYYGWETITQILLGDICIMPSQQTKYGDTALHLAMRDSSGGQGEMVRMLLEKGIKVNQTNIDGDTALHLAAKYGYENVVEQLLAYTYERVDLNILNGTGETPLHQAASRGYTQIVKLLLDHGVNIDAQDFKGMTALHRTALGSCDNAVIMRYLEHIGGKPRILDEEAKAEVYKEAYSGYEAIVRMLLEKGAEVDVQDVDGATALLKAMITGSTGIVRILSEAGARPDASAWLGEFGRDGVFKSFLADSEV